MKNCRKILITLAILTLTVTVFAFEWPLQDASTSKIHTYFGQKRSGTVSTSIVFSESGTAVSCEEGRVTITISEAPEDGDWFESTLGNAVIISHEGAFSTVYANLDADTLNKSFQSTPRIPSGTQIATTGNSGWQDSTSYLEFQVIDAEKKAFINPLILMPRSTNQPELSLSSIVLENKLGKRYEIANLTNIPAGAYTLYKKRQDVAVPYKTAVYVNGSESELIVYDAIRQNEGRLCAVKNGRENKYYNEKEIYPDEEFMRMGNVFLPHGKNTISVIATDFLGKEKIVRFSVNSY
ncbi:MAG: peptidoglycan DD-metalloendopeptidase family protein [Treponema sp.]|nr:peptidoglycan DD-metalloendopeptidase family protein [Treponema sp.]